MSDDAILLDYIGLKCPHPALRAGKALLAARPGQRFEIRCTDPMAAIDIPHLLNTGGDRLEDSRQEGRVLIFLVRKAGDPI